MAFLLGLIFPLLFFSFPPLCLEFLSAPRAVFRCRTSSAFSPYPAHVPPPAPLFAFPPPPNARGFHEFALFRPFPFLPLFSLSAFLSYLPTLRISFFARSARRRCDWLPFCWVLSRGTALFSNVPSSTPGVMPALYNRLDFPKVKVKLSSVASLRLRLG